MGKIIGIGGGFEGKDFVILAKYIISLTGKSTPKYLQIPTTCYDLGDRGEFGFYAKMGCPSEFLYLTHPYINEDIIAEKIRNADIIHVPGGNLKFCMDIWNKTGAGKYLKEAFDDGKVLYGQSSGSMCWFSQGYDDCGPESAFMLVDCLGLLPYTNCPHYECEAWQGFNETVKLSDFSGLALENETAFLYIDGKTEVLVADARPDARVWFFDKENDFIRTEYKS